MKKLKIITLLIVLLNIVITLKSQNIRYSQHLYSNPLKINPALMSINSDLKLLLNYRNQWGNIGNGFSTYDLTMMYPLYIGNDENKLDLGLAVLNDKYGAFSKLDFSLSVGYNLKVADNNYLNLSLQGGYIQQSITTTDLTFDDQYVLGSYNTANSSAEVISSEKKGIPDISFGFLWNYNTKKDEALLNGFAGISVFHVNEPEIAFLNGIDKLPRRYSYQLGLKILGKNKLDFTPNIIGNIQGGSSDISSGLYINYNFSENSKLITGIWYRKSKEIACFLGFEHQYFMVGYSYDFPNSSMNKYFEGIYTHEITLHVKLNMKGNDTKRML